MREILFRGKRVDNGEWVEGLLFTYNGNHCIQLEGIGCDDYGLYPRCYAEIITESISEFTSLTDKNGKKIFEGDKLKTVKGVGYVVYGKGCFCVQYEGQNKPAIDIVMHYGDVSVIGNIHDNPELLKGE